ncbi:hypothetical protein BGZ57DRAFT_855129 [Hyaloscypha finlandica]|nr:hypothetical protein BGZ57DRAFT_855129 [Hyaloscypha finlandica]
MSSSKDNAKEDSLERELGYEDTTLNTGRSSKDKRDKAKEEKELLPNVLQLHLRELEHVLSETERRGSIKKKQLNTGNIVNHNTEPKSPPLPGQSKDLPEVAKSDLPEVARPDASSSGSRKSTVVGPAKSALSVQTTGPLSLESLSIKKAEMARDQRKKSRFYHTTSLSLLNLFRPANKHEEIHGKNEIMRGFHWNFWPVDSGGIRLKLVIVEDGASGKTCFVVVSTKSLFPELT